MSITKTEIDLLEANLALPSAEELRPYLKKLAAHDGSAIIIGIEIRGGAPHVGRAWLNRAERNALRKAIGRVNDARHKRGESLTSEEVK